MFATAPHIHTRVPSRPCVLLTLTTWRPEHHGLCVINAGPGLFETNWINPLARMHVPVAHVCRATLLSLGMACARATHARNLARIAR